MTDSYARKRSVPVATLIASWRPLAQAPYVALAARKFRIYAVDLALLAHQKVSWISFPFKSVLLLKPSISE